MGRLLFGLWVFLIIFTFLLQNAGIQSALSIDTPSRVANLPMLTWIGGVTAYAIWAICENNPVPKTSE